MTTVGAAVGSRSTPIAPQRTRRFGHPEARWLHPYAWWSWAIGCAAAAAATTNPIVLLLVGVALANVAAARRLPGDAGRAFGVFVRIAVFIVVVRLVLTILIGTRVPGTVLFTLPSVELPTWMAGLTLGGPVTVEQLAGALFGGIRLGVIVACFGAVNSVSSPYRLVRAFPAVLHEAGVVISVGVSLAPQLVLEVGRVRAARRLRGRPGGVRGLRGTVLPVLESALESAMHRAASMDARGYGRRAVVSKQRQRTASAAMIVGVIGLLIGTYALLDGSAPTAVRLPAVAVGVAALTAGLWLAGARSSRSTYRPDRWALSEWLVAASGVGAAVMLGMATGSDRLEPTLQPLRVPLPNPASLVAVALVLVPMLAAPAVPGGPAHRSSGERP